VSEGGWAGPGAYGDGGEAASSTVPGADAQSVCGITVAKAPIVLQRRGAVGHFGRYSNPELLDQFSADEFVKPTITSVGR